MKLSKIDIGKVVGVWFFISLFAFGCLRTDYSHSTKAVSELGGIGAPFAIYWNLIGFFGTGVLIVLFGWGLRERLKQCDVASTGGMAVILLGIVFGATAIPADFNLMFESPWTIAHAVFALLGPVPFIWAIIVWTRALRRLKAPTGLTIATLVSGLLIVPVFLLYGVLPNSPGIVQRLVFAVIFIWCFALAVAINSCPIPTSAQD